MTIGNKNKKIFLIIEFITLFILIFSISFIIFNFDSLFLKLKYKFFSQQKINKEEITKTEIKAEACQVIFEDKLIIPKINISVPIVFTEKEENILEDLKRGVAFYPGGVGPGKVGNTIILGHSSNYGWEKGNYNSIFANLSELKNSDEIVVDYQWKKYSYRVFKEITLFPNKVKEEIFKPEKESILTLITCWPTGTDFKRMLIKAYLVSQEEF